MTRNRGGSPHVNFASFELWWTTFLKMLLPKLSSINYGLFWLFFDNFFWPKFSKINSEIFFLSVFWLISLLPLFGFFLLICLIGFNGKPLIRLIMSKFLKVPEGFKLKFSYWLNSTQIGLPNGFNPNNGLAFESGMNHLYIATSRASYRSHVRTERIGEFEKFKNRPKFWFKILSQCALTNRKF